MWKMWTATGFGWAAGRRARQINLISKGRTLIGAVSGISLTNPPVAVHREGVMPGKPVSRRSTRDVQRFKDQS